MGREEKGKELTLGQFPFPGKERKCVVWSGVCKAVSSRMWMYTYCV
jgi:hypothetical protein